MQELTRIYSWGPLIFCLALAVILSSSGRLDILMLHPQTSSCLPGI
jgi:hypothetical protein